MTSEHQTERMKFWFMVTAYYNQPVPDAVLAMYADDCKDVTVDELKWAFEQYRRGPSSAFRPVPGKLLELIHPPVDDDAEAHAVVQRIIHCLAPFKRADDAREYMGELAWEVVRAMGGWRWFGENPPPNSFVQREMLGMAKAIIVRARQGREHEPPSLGGSTRPLIGSGNASLGDSAVSNVRALVSDALKGKELK